MFTALIFAPCPLDRPLMAEELTHQLQQKERLPEQPACQRSVIAMTDEYLEIVDHGYAHKGAILRELVGFVVFFILFLCGMLWYSRPDTGYAPGDIESFVVAFGTLCVPLGALALWLLSKEFFGYTHYPIRFDRVRRKVHVFRRDGSVLTASWNRLFFTLAVVPELKWGVVRAHLLDGDRNTVRATFTLSHTEPGYALASDYGPAIRWRPDDGLRAHWELVRRYMEEGPQAVAGCVELRLPIATRRETFAECRAHLVRERRRLGFGVVPFTPFDAACRWLALRSCKLPRWPEAMPE